MGAFSKSAKVCFEILNELYTAVGAGVLGMAVLLQHGFRSHQTVKCLSVVGITAASLVFVFSRDKPKITANKKKVVMITGCDSGKFLRALLEDQLSYQVMVILAYFSLRSSLGFSFAQHAAECGFTVIATFLSLDSKGSKEIKRLYGGYIIQIQLDVTDSTSIQNAVQTMEHYFSKNPGYTRLVTISSHCALANLPGLTVYGATKAALMSWNDGIRIEMAKYGVQVVTFIPGGICYYL
ncbi:hypothetical protein YQE_00679, partial [Dendroctonus ponderosae]